MHRRAVPVVVGARPRSPRSLGPAAYSVQTVATGHSGSIVDAGPTVAGGTGGPGGGGGARGGQAPGRATAQGPAAPAAPPRAGGRAAAAWAACSTPRPRARRWSRPCRPTPTSTRWVAAAIGSQNAAGLQLGTQLPVMAIGGFNGSDPSPTLAQFQDYVAAGQIHYFLAGGGFGGGQSGGSNVSSQISTWVQQNFTAVTIGGSTFYDLTQPGLGVHRAPRPARGRCDMAAVVVTPGSPPSTALAGHGSPRPARPVRRHRRRQHRPAPGPAGRPHRPAGRPGGQPGRTGGLDRRQHGGQPGLDVPGPGSRADGPAAPPGPGGLRDHLGVQQCGARAARRRLAAAPRRSTTVAVVGLANAVSTVARFTAMRGWIFRSRA